MRLATTSFCGGFQSSVCKSLLRVQRLQAFAADRRLQVPASALVTSSLCSDLHPDRPRLCQWCEVSVSIHHIFWNFSMPFSPQVLRGSRKCWHLRGATSSLCSELHPDRPRLCFVRSLYQSTLSSGTFLCLFPQVLRGSRKCWHLRGASRPTSLTGERCFGGRCLQCASSAALPYRFPPPIRLSRSMLAAYSCEQFWTHFPCEVRPPVCPNGRSLSCSEDTPACASRV